MNREDSMKRLLTYSSIGVLLIAGAYGIWVQLEKKAVVAGSYRLCGLTELYGSETGVYPADRSDIVKLLEQEKSPRTSRPYLSGSDPFFSQEGRVVEYRRTSAGAFVIVVRTDNRGMRKLMPSARCESGAVEKGTEFRPNCSCELAP
jgi:hypothetical protein